MELGVFACVMNLLHTFHIGDKYWKIILQNLDIDFQIVYF